MKSALLAGAVLLATPAIGAAPAVALVCGKQGERESTVRAQPLGAAQPAPPLTRFEHLPWAVVRGGMLPEGEVAMVVADLRRRGDPSFGATLLRLEPGAPPRVLAENVAHASRPHVTAEGRVFIERGAPGAEPDVEAARRGELRTDALTIDEIDPASGVARQVHRFAGYTTHLAGSFEGQLVVYRVDRSGAELVLIPMKGGAPRVLISDLPPFAREFSVDDSGRLLFVNADRASRRWRLESLDLRSLERKILTTSPRPGLAPFAWRGEVYYSPDGAAGLARLERGERVELNLFGAGSDRLEARSPDGRWIALSHRLPSTLPLPVSLGIDGVGMPLAYPSGERCEVLGFVGEAAR